MEKKFVPKPGQVDYTGIRWAPVINCIATYNGKILLLQRSVDMRVYPEYWNGVSGFLDDHRSLVEKVNHEVRQELGLEEDMIGEIKTGPVFDYDDPEYGKTWIIHPVLVELKTENIRPDWESQNTMWLDPKDVTDENFKLIPGLLEVLKALQLT